MMPTGKKRSGPIFGLLMIQMFFIQTSFSIEESACGVFWSPRIPPVVQYTMDCALDIPNGMLRGHVVATFRNPTHRVIELLTIARPGESGDSRGIFMGDQPARVVGGPVQGQWLVQLPRPLQPGQEVSLTTDFRLLIEAMSPDLRFVEFHPKIVWGFPSHNDYDVAIDCPTSWTLVCSGLRDPKNGRYQAKGIRNFGMVALKNGKLLEAESKGVFVRCLFNPEGEGCARLLVEAAGDAIAYYNERFGFYPRPFLNIVPGMDRPVGGYPFATGLVVVHGQERMSEKPESHWRWIMAHEIGHQYWMEHVMSRRADQWLMIGLGLYADREYAKARKIGLSNHDEIMRVYLEGVEQGLDTKMNRTASEIQHVEFDFNNVVEHGKSFSFISALSCLMGKDLFEKAGVRCLREYEGRCLTPADFQRVCEETSGLDLGGFFENWISTNRHLSYEIASQSTTKKNGTYESEAHVKCLGTMNMPIPVEVSFDDGTSQRRCTDGFLKECGLHFQSKAKMIKATLDPDGELALAKSRINTQTMDLAKEILTMDHTNAGERSRILFSRALRENHLPIHCWLKLGLTLYDGQYYSEALEAFTKGAELAKSKRDPWLFVYLTWQGHLCDLKGDRAEAIAHYRKALEVVNGGTMRHDQYEMIINRRWIEERLKSPFTRK